MDDGRRSAGGWSHGGRAGWTAGGWSSLMKQKQRQAGDWWPGPGGRRDGRLESGEEQTCSAEAIHKWVGGRAEQPYPKVQ